MTAYADELQGTSRETKCSYDVAMSSEPIVFHFDFLSPYAYLAWTQIHRIAGAHGRTVAPVPTLLAALLAHGKTKGPAEIPAKRVYLALDTVRTAKLLGVPYEPPAAHPFNPLLPLRIASLDGSADEKRARIDALYSAAWAKSQPIDGEEGAAKVLDAAGMNGRDLVTRATSQDAKDRLRTQTESAIARGVFGVPTMFIGDAMFWGVDSLGHVERHLRGEGIDGMTELKRWMHVRPSAQRREAKDG
jgi:2-hydroxychromene-2-carboxylate isomerase